MLDTPVIEAHQLLVGYQPSKPILKDFNAQIFPSEFIVVLGPNGAGKTTLLRTLLGLIKPLQGNLTVQGHPAHRGCVAVGYMPQHALTLAAHNISGRTLLMASQQGQHWGMPINNAWQKEQVAICLAKVEATDFADQAFASLSGGQQKRILLAQALLNEPRVLLLDEPLANLDLRYQESFIDILMRLVKEQRLTVILTAHDVNPLMRAVTRVLYVANQQAILGSVAEVLNSQTLSQLYRTDIDVVDYHGRLLVMNAASGKSDHDHAC